MGYMVLYIHLEGIKNVALLLEPIVYMVRELREPTENFGSPLNELRTKRLEI